MPDRRKRRRKTTLMEVVELKHDGKPRSIQKLIYKGIWLCAASLW